jgi:hypothetical protein
VEILKQLLVALHRKMPELWPNGWILHHDNAPDHKALSVKQFLAQKSITEMENPSYSSALAPNNVWLFPKIKSALKEKNISGHWRHQKKYYDDGTDRHSTTSVPKMFLTVAASLS